jgi:nicotinamidase-related amidase
MKALIVIDYTNDFVADTGKLTCGKPGQAIDSFIAAKMEEFIANGDSVFIANDLHFEEDTYHPEHALFPPHNIFGTDGRKLFGQVGVMYEHLKNAKHIYTFDKTRYSAFVGTPLHTMLQERSIKDITLVGVCTDICVLHTAVDSYNLGYTVTIFEKGVASFNEQGHHWALSHFKNTLGALVQ